MTNHYDVAIIGGGISGLTAAIYLSRANLSVAIVEGYFIDATEVPGGQVATTPDIENFPGFNQGEGTTLISIARKQALDLGAIILEDVRAQGIDYSTTPHNISLESYGEPAGSITADRVLIATGARVRRLGITGEDEYYGQGVSACATCDGAFFADKTVSVVGGGDVAVEDALYLANIARELNILIRADKFTSTQMKMIAQLESMPHVNILFNTRVKEIKGETVLTDFGMSKSVSSLVIETSGVEREIPSNALFIAIGRDPQSALAQCASSDIVLELDDSKYLVADNGGRTNIPTVYVAGDVMDWEYRQAIVAAGSGAKAAMNITRDAL